MRNPYIAPPLWGSNLNGVCKIRRRWTRNAVLTGACWANRDIQGDPTRRPSWLQLWRAPLQVSGTRAPLQVSGTRAPLQVAVTHLVKSDLIRIPARLYIQHAAVSSVFYNTGKALHYAVVSSVFYNKLNDTTSFLHPSNRFSHAKLEENIESKFRKPIGVGCMWFRMKLILTYLTLIGILIYT